MVIKTRKKKTDRQKQIALLDSLISEYSRKYAMQKVGGCLRCHAPKRDYKELQAAHLITRHDHTTRWDISNVVGICGGCHRAIDSHAEAKIEFAIRILGEAEYDRLYVLANMTTKQSPVDLKLKEIELRTLLKEV
jgi:5-methylcytosine-specific restriction endonuclease McrA